MRILVRAVTAVAALVLALQGVASAAEYRAKPTLKRHHVVRGHRAGNAVFYTLAHPKIAELLLIARTFLADTLAAQRDRLDAVESLPPIGTPR